MAGIGQILAWVAWVAWIHKILAWVAWVDILVWVKKTAWVSVLLFNHILQKTLHLLYNI